MAGKENRRHERLSIVVECRVEGISGHGSMRLGDLSLSGCYVDSATTVPIGSEVSISATLGGRQVLLIGRVVHSHPRVGFGVRFDALPEEVTAVINSYLGTALQRPHRSN